MDVPRVDKHAPLAIEKQSAPDPLPAIEKRNRILFAFGTAAVVAIVAATAGVVWQSSNMSEPTQDAPQIKNEPTEAAEPRIQVSDLTFEVWNGSGVTGAAAKKAEALRINGLKVVSVATAPKNYAQDELLVRSEYTEVVTSILAKLGMADITGELTEGTAAARLILGK